MENYLHSLTGTFQKLLRMWNKTMENEIKGSMSLPRFLLPLK